MNEHRITPTLLLRGIVFYTGAFATILWFATSGALIFWLPLRTRIAYMLLWCRFTIWWGRFSFGIRHQLIGAANIPSTPVVILSKHESQWETIYLQSLLHPVATIVKKELLSQPGFNLMLRTMQPIAIDRTSPIRSLKYVLRAGMERLSDGSSVLVFPEGTRTEPGQTSAFARSGASLALKANVPVLPIAHNAGSCCPPEKLLRFPGMITVVIGKPIETGGRRAAGLRRKSGCGVKRRNCTKTSPPANFTWWADAACAPS